MARYRTPRWPSLSLEDAQRVFAAMSGREAPFIFFTGLLEDLSDRWQ